MATQSFMRCWIRHVWRPEVIHRIITGRLVVLSHYVPNFPAITQSRVRFFTGIGLLIWAYVFWLLASLGVVLGAIFLFLLYWGFRRGFGEIRTWFSFHKRVVLGIELVFIVKQALSLRQLARAVGNNRIMLGFLC